MRYYYREKKKRSEIKEDVDQILSLALCSDVSWPEIIAALNFQFTYGK